MPDKKLKELNLADSSTLSGDDLDGIAPRIVELVKERGKLSKNEILILFQLPPDSYPDLKKVIDKKYKGDVEPGPQRVGGFVATYHRRGRPQLPSSLPPPTFQLSEWEKKAVERLVELLDHKTLEDLLGNLTYTIRKLRAMETGEDRRGTKDELANALLIGYGRDLLAVKDIRAAVAKACDVSNPAAWHPGKEGALEFVTRCHLPIELAGILSPERQPDYERVEGKLSLPPLWEFQLELKTEILRHLLEGQCRMIATLPTGAGKTRLMVEALSDFWVAAESESNAVIWLAHTEELCEQAFECFKDVWESESNVSPILCIRYWGSYSRNVDAHAIATKSLLNEKVLVISTPIRLYNAVLSGAGPETEFASKLLSKVRVVVIDEAHRAGAPTYSKLAEKLTGVNHAVSLFGLTATPYRVEYLSSSDGIEALQQIFDQLLESKMLGDSPREKLQSMGVLAELEIKELKTDIELRFPPNTPESIDRLTLEEQQKVDDQLKALTDLPRRRLNILPYITDIVKNNPAASVLYFGPSVEDAQAMTFLLRTRSIDAAFVGAETRTATRRQIIENFKTGRLKVLCNCEVLTTGFDAPKVTHVIIARPTVSKVLWEQMIGRGLRGEKFGGTRKCVVYDCLDNFKGEEGKVRGFLEYKRVWYEQMSTRKHSA